MLLFSGNANRPLAEAIAAELDLELSRATVSQFADAESSIQIDADVHSQDTFIIQPTSFPANQHIVELCLIAAALQQSGARTITAVIPYYGYARQDRVAHSQ